MRYRMEMLEDDDITFVVRNVETDLVLGFASLLCAPNPPDADHLTYTGCRVLNRYGREIAGILAKFVPDYLACAPVAVANHVEGSGYADFKPLEVAPAPMRVELLLGTLLADTACEIARALNESSNGGLKTETKERFADLIVQLYRIWFVSHFGSWDAERRVLDPYFANSYASGPRMSFAAAAQEHGMWELRTRFPDASDEALKVILSLPLEMLSGTLERTGRPHTDASSLRECLRAIQNIGIGKAPTPHKN